MLLITADGAESNEHRAGKENTSNFLCLVLCCPQDDFAFTLHHFAALLFH